MPNRPVPNLVLRELMAQHALSREKLADRVCEAAIKLTGAPVNCTVRQVQRWLSGEVAWPRRRYRELLEAVFGRPAIELGFAAPEGMDRAMVRTSIAPATTLEQPVLRRHFIIGLGRALALPVLPTTGRLGLGDIDAIQAAVAELHAADDQHGGAELAAVAAGYIAHVETTARACSYGSAVQSRLYTALGELAASAGWFAYDGGEQEAASRWWDKGIRYATLASDTVLQARIWSYMARQAAELGHGGEAVAIARVALDATRNRREPRLSALLHARVALGHSLTGERGRAGQSLARAEMVLDRAPDRTMPWLAFCGPAEIAGQAALVDFNLGRFGRAADRDVDAAGLLPSTFTRNSFAIQVSLARNLFAAGEVDAALAAGERAVDLVPRVASPRWGRHLATFAQDVQQRGVVGARAFTERYEAATR